MGLDGDLGAQLRIDVEEERAAYSAAKVLLCISRRSTSPVLCTRKALWPEGMRWRVFLLEP